MPLTSEAIATFALETSFDGLSSDVVEKVEHVILDSVGCSLNAYPSPPVKVLRRIYGGRGGADGATILGTDSRVSVEYAALINGAMVRYLDYNDCYVSGGSVCHPSDHVPPLVSVAEAEDADGRDLIEAIAVAYEIQCRGVDTGAVWESGFDYVTWGVYSTAAAAGKLMGLSHEELRDAIGIAGTSSNGLLIARLGDVSMWKGTAHSYAAHNAIQACQMARGGMSGPASVFEGEGGFFDTVTRRELDVSFGEAADRVMRTNLKPHPCGYFMQSAIEATKTIVAEHDVDPEAITAVHVETFDQSVQVLGDAEKWSAELNRETADHSLPYATALAILEGDLGPEHFGPEWLENPRVHELMGMVEVSADPELTRERAENPGTVPAVITIETGDGSYTGRVDRPIGHSTNPMSTEQLRSKARSLMEPLLADDQIERTFGACLGLADLDSMDELLGPLVI